MFWTTNVARQRGTTGDLGIIPKTWLTHDDIPIHAPHGQGLGCALNPTHDLSGAIFWASSTHSTRATRVQQPSLSATRPI